MRVSRVAVAAVVLISVASYASAGGVEDGKKALAEKRWGDAATAFQKVIAGAPKHREAALGLAKAATKGALSDSFDAADEALREVLSAKSDDREARLALGDLCLARAAEDDRWRADAQDQFGRLLRADPSDVDAAAGMARYWWSGADHVRALAVLDEVLERKPDAPVATYWKGVVLYDRATQGFQAAGQRMTDEVRGSFEAALASFQASTKADPSRYDAWIRAGYAAQYLAREDESKQAVAAAAYRKAIDLDGDDEAAMRGLSALYSGGGSRWVEVLDALAKEKPATPVVLYYQGYSLLERKRYDDAEKALRAYVKVAKRPAAGWHEIGKTLAAKGDAAGALEAYRKSLQADPHHGRWRDASTALAQPIRDRMRDAQGDAAKSREVVKDAAAVMALAPRDLWLRNDVAFFCREFPASKDRAMLDAAIKYYVEASDLVGEYGPEYETSVPYPNRHQFAQVLNDTGLMFHYYPETRDLEKAEAYYRRALEWTQNGYWDAFGNLVKLLVEKGRWQEAYDVARACAEGIRNENGTESAARRAAAREEASRLEAKIPK